jgi:hypothetical protein
MPARGKLLAAAELAFAAALIVGANIYDVVPVSETPWLILIGWFSLWRRGIGWRGVGLARPVNWGATVALALIAGAGLQALSEFVTEPLIENLTGVKTDLSSFAELVGNLPATLQMLALVWTLAAFGEELSYRGYVLERAASLGGKTPAAYLVSMVVVALLFGVGHWYQGPSGVAGSMVSGLYFGALYLVSGRNLWLAILAHGFSDTIGLGLIYFGVFGDLSGG